MYDILAFITIVWFMPTFAVLINLKDRRATAIDRRNTLVAALAVAAILAWIPPLCMIGRLLVLGTI